MIKILELKLLNKVYMDKIINRSLYIIYLIKFIKFYIKLLKFYQIFTIIIFY